MLLAIFALSAGAASGYLAGHLATHRSSWSPVTQRGRDWRAPALVPAGVVLVTVGDRWVGGTPGLAIVAAGYTTLVAFAVINCRRHGLALVAVGLLANLTVLLVDGGMPVQSEPPGLQIGSHHHGLSSRDHLAGLADTLRVNPLGETVSPGDLLVAAGGTVAMFFFWLEPREGRGWWAGRRPRGRGTGHSAGAAGRAASPGAAGRAGSSATVPPSRRGRAATAGIVIPS